MSAWFNYAATLKILIFSLLVGAALPGLFAVGVRVSATGAVSESPAQRKLLSAVSWAIFAGVLAVVLVGVLFIARDFIAHNTGLYLLGAKHPKH